MVERDEIGELVNAFRIWLFDSRPLFTGLDGYTRVLSMKALGELTPLQLQIVEKGMLPEVRKSTRNWESFLEYFLHWHQRKDALPGAGKLGNIVGNFAGKFSWPGNEVQVSVDLPEELPWINTCYDVSYLFRNLAVHFKDREPARAIAVSAYQDGDRVAVRVRIERSILPSEVEHPDRFFYAGTPISVSQMIALRHGSELTITEISEHGLTFEFSLPVWVEEAKEPIKVEYSDEVKDVINLFHYWREDVRVPLMRVKMYVDLLLNGTVEDLNSEQREILEGKISRLLRRALGMWQHVYDYTVHWYQRKDALTGPGDLASMVRAVVQQISEDKAVGQVTVDLPEGLPSVHTFEGADDLFKGLVDPLRDLDPAQRMAVSARLEGEWVVVTVRIDRKIESMRVGNLVGLFYPGAPASISQMIAQRHGRELKVLNFSESGLTFEFALPVWEGARG